MNSHNYSEGANTIGNTITKSESERDGQNAQNFSNYSGFQMNSTYNNPEGADTIRNRLVFADTRSASEFHYYADYHQLGPNFQNITNRINSEFQINSNYSKATVSQNIK